ncbi:TetR family transcriptional regulator [Gordonia sp. CPCC 206044]|uniref:TetR/AcrR family transcriptional regulator n=1 Tax=Gordonia sp. CPCC 206044 TaxID=3140793 RepID=UPI003AF403E7
MSRFDRRQIICDATLDLAAAGGNHAVSHQAVDRHLSLPKGSTSYYFRTRQALISAAAQRLVDRSRAAFDERFGGDGRGPDAIELISDYLDELLTDRRRDVLARAALVQEPVDDSAIVDVLARCFFSVDAAVALMRSRAIADPEAAADRLITVLEGIAFAHTHGLHGRADPRRGELAPAMRPLVSMALGTPPADTG